MIFLLDVNALISYGFTEHHFHPRVLSWVKFLTSEKGHEFASTPITELGFVRVLSQAPAYGITVEKAKSLLRQVKKTSPLIFSFIIDQHDISHLPSWVKSGRSTTDGHLVQLARANGAVLATLDENIPNSFLIPRV